MKLTCTVLCANILSGFLGYFCPPGQSMPNPFSCEPGYFCQVGSHNMTFCASGTYQDESTQGACKECNAGFYCDFADRPLTDFSPYPCPMGYYCPNGTEFAQQYGCPPGTYNSGTNLEAEADCTPCDAGQFCDGFANVAVDGDCDEGNGTLSKLLGRP